MVTVGPASCAAADAVPGRSYRPRYLRFYHYCYYSECTTVLADSVECLKLKNTAGTVAGRPRVIRAPRILDRWILFMPEPTSWSAGYPTECGGIRPGYRDPYTGKRRGKGEAFRESSTPPALAGSTVDRACVRACARACVLCQKSTPLTRGSVPRPTP